MEVQREVISVPVSKTFHIIEATNVHACPDRYPYK
jgi:hypothetical protein